MRGCADSAPLLQMVISVRGHHIALVALKEKRAVG